MLQLRLERIPHSHFSRKRGRGRGAPLRSKLGTLLLRRIEDPNALARKGLDTIEKLSQENLAVADTDGSSDKFLNKGGASILLLFPEGRKREHISNTGVIISYFTSELLAISEALTIYMTDSPAMDTSKGLTTLSNSKWALRSRHKRRD
ncbi:hypothetical protein TNCV_4585171 [Trichonephila clavipes]|nr:hypothetical protein TNCV_4585171 [Trichonephila clavipes]